MKNEKLNRESLYFSRLFLLRDIFFLQKVDSSRQKDNPDILFRNKVF